MRAHRTLVAMLASIALLLAACTPDGGSEPAPTLDDRPVEDSTTQGDQAPAEQPDEEEDLPMVDPAPCEFDVPAGRTVECGWLAVPADRSDPGSDTIRLHVAVFESESASPAPDPVVYLEGGPGGDALEVVPLTFEDRFAHLLANRHVIFFDQRGTGFSDPSLACPELRELGLELIDEELPTNEIIVQQERAILECRDRLVREGVNLDSFNSAESAADLADLRIALGYDEWNLYGISYGTRLALTTLRDWPEGIRSVILDSVYPPQVDLVSAAPANLDRALEELFTGCAADATCSAAFPDLEPSFYDLIVRLDETPIRAPVTDVFTGRVYDAVFNGASLAGIVFQGLYSADVIEVLPQMITNVAAGETYELSVLTSSFLANGEFVSAGMQFSVQCNEEAVFTDRDTVTTAYAEFPELETLFETSANLGAQFFNTCAAWGAGQAPPLENEPITSDVPTLVLAGEYDPITPPQWGRLAAETLSQSTYVEFPGVGHGPSADRDCPKAIVRGFLDDPTGDPDLNCADGMSGPAFATADAAIPDVNLVAFSDSAFGATLTGVHPEGWEPVGPGAWSRGLNGLDQTALVQQFAAGATPDVLLGLIAQQFGLGANPEVADTYTSPTGSWSIYRGEAVGAPVSVALSEQGGGTILVVLVTAPDEADQLVQLILLPVLEAATVG
jgi:pimeloyl-ACP methyl ester carboxylesterase